MKSRVIDIDEIKKYLPHRFPFLYLDKVLEFDDRTIKGLKNVTANEPFFAGHFPDYPVMPGVLIVEALAQVCGMFGLLKTEEDNKNFTNLRTLFTGINNVKFKRPVRPGDTLMLEAVFVKRKMSIWWFEVKATVDGELACSGELSAILR